MCTHHLRADQWHFYDDILDYSMYSVLPKRCDIQFNSGSRVVFGEKQRVAVIAFVACAELVGGSRLPSYSPTAGKRKDEMDQPAVLTS